VYVADSKAHRIVKFDAQGKLLTAWGSAGSGPGQFNGQTQAPQHFPNSPYGVAVDGAGNVYVSDTWNHRVEKFSATGTFLTQWGSKDQQIGAGAGEFYGPRGIAVLPDGSVAVADTGNKRIEVFSAAGTYLRSIGTSGSGNGQLNEPSGVAADGAGNLYVADYWNGRIQKFTEQGVYLTQWAVPGWSTPGFYTEPYIAVDGAGQVIVPDPTDGRVLVYSPSGVLVAALGSAGSAAGQFSTPLGVAADGSALWVGDQGNGRLQKVALP
jgi:sugar lactone lactonase YvrE